MITNGRRQFTVAEAARLLGWRPNTMHRAIREGRVRARDLNAGTGRRPRYRLAASEVKRLAREV